MEFNGKTLTVFGKFESTEGDASEAFEAGKKAEYDAFWDAFQQNGKRTSYAYGFTGIGWTDENFKPKYDIRPTNAIYVFRESMVKNMKQCLESCGVSLDLSSAKNCDRLFYGMERLTILPKINISSAESCPYIFANCYALTTIEELRIGEKTTFASSTSFVKCNALTNLTMTGVLATNGLNLADCKKLSHESLMSVLNVLQDKTAVGGTWTVTLGTENLAKLTDTEKAIATQKGWSLV